MYLLTTLVIVSYKLTKNSPGIMADPRENHYTILIGINDIKYSYTVGLGWLKYNFSSNLYSWMTRRMGWMRWGTGWMRWRVCWLTRVGRRLSGRLDPLQLPSQLPVVRKNGPHAPILECLKKIFFFVSSYKLWQKWCL